jgi:hypothetical protein
MVGLLCENEPLPPETIEHYAAYMGIIASIRCELNIELKRGNGEVGEDLIIDDSEAAQSRFSDEEKEQRSVHLAAVRRKAEKNKAKLEHEDLEDIPEFKQQAEPFDPDLATEQIGDYFQVLYGGKRPAPVKRPLNNAERYTFCWRRLLHAALLEDEELPLPLSEISFDWRSNNQTKWMWALEMLMVVHYDSTVSATEQALVEGEIGIHYADPSQHLRIQTTTKMVKDLRMEYDTNWNLNKSLFDQHCIFALASNTECHHPFQEAFAARLQEHGFDAADDGNYQVRYDVFQQVPSSLWNSLEAGDPSYVSTDFGEFHDAKTPLDYKDCAGGWKVEPFCHSILHYVGMCNGKRGDQLLLCSRCKTVSYCSKECQARDWVYHKKQCKELSALRKDKDKLKELAKEF